MSFFELIIYLVYAMLGGFLSTIPPGPLNIRLIIFFLKDEKKSLFFFQFGILLADTSVCIIAFILANKTHENTVFLNFGKNNLIFIQIIFTIVLIYIGLSHILSARKEITLKKEQIDNVNIEKDKQSKFIRHFLEGIVGTLTIPSLLPFWYLWWMGQNLTYNQPISLSVIFIAIGVCFGDLFIFKLYRYFIFHIQERILQFRIAKIEKWVGYFILFFALLFSIKFFIF